MLWLDIAEQVLNCGWRLNQTWRDRLGSERWEDRDYSCPIWTWRCAVSRNYLLEEHIHNLNSVPTFFCQRTQHIRGKEPGWLSTIWAETLRFLEASCTRALTLKIVWCYVQTFEFQRSVTKHSQLGSWPRPTTWQRDVTERLQVVFTADHGPFNSID